MLQVFLPSSVGGLGLPDFRVQRLACYAAVSYATWPTTTTAIPSLSQLDLTADPSTLPAPAADFAATYSAVVDAHQKVVGVYTEKDRHRFFYVTGHERRHFRPSYPASREFPLLSDLYADRTPVAQLSFCEVSLQ